MPRSHPTRRVPRHHLALHRPPQRRDSAGAQALRTSDLILALLGVVMLGGLALAAAFVLAAGATAP
ncbi:hypothetical protein [Methylobacterium aerolatum]|uniref:Uncharacterized protein n=1 Tax=Methylobacterium aerolatum TaxID=418708 RepID=A0ABU0HWZ3_9HYPH|nr:hypothetical protein [Methylobacterium aerolatum]MDQ0446006.1 hypothetical protein [Methylobacterium aerolatum]GJD35043.1 hypothetical protein FMGBMHLM_1950 [Methylobacterium aerolatum]